MQTTISYGKGQVSVYRTYARPLAGLTPIPESAFTGHSNILFGGDVDLEVFGDNFLPSYTKGDNASVVATDSMKNFVHRMALAFDGSTLESFLRFVGERFLATYPPMQSLRLTGREAPFVAASVPDGSGSFVASEVLFARSQGDRSYACVEISRGGVSAVRSGREGLKLIKVTGSAFKQFVRDAHTTLPETVDRPLFIYLNVYWRYARAEDAVGDDAARYVAAEQVRDLAQVTFHEFVSLSIQHLVHEMGQRILRRFPGLAEVSFEAQNRLWDTAEASEADPRLKVYTDPRPPYGMIGLTLRRDDA